MEMALSPYLASLVVTLGNKIAVIAKSNLDVLEKQSSEESAFLAGDGFASRMVQGDLLIFDRLRIPLREVERLDDEEWVKALTRAQWLEERSIHRMVAAIATAFKGS